jgi:hypothetical protein
MLFTLIGALVAAAGAACWLIARRPKPREPNPQLRAKEGRSRQGGRFGAVQIRARLGACRAAQLLQGQRFLAKDAPPLPLRECSAARCACTFSKMPDRRTESRRLQHGGLHTTLFIAANRRIEHDRRRSRQRAREKNG